MNQIHKIWELHQNKKKDYLSMRVKSEFVGESFEVQNIKIEKGISILKKNNLNNLDEFQSNNDNSVTFDDRVGNVLTNWKKREN